MAQIQIHTDDNRQPLTMDSISLILSQRRFEKLGSKDFPQKGHVPGSSQKDTKQLAWRITTCYADKIANAFRLIWTGCVLKLLTKLSISFQFFFSGKSKFKRLHWFIFTLVLFRKTQSPHKNKIMAINFPFVVVFFSTSTITIFIFNSTEFELKKKKTEIKLKRNGKGKKKNVREIILMWSINMNSSKIDKNISYSWIIS